MTGMDPLNDRLDIYSAQLGTVSEIAPSTLAKYLLKAGNNISLTPNPDGTWTIGSPIILGNVTFWVRTDGSDSNDGSANDPQHALATLPEAIARAANAFGSAIVTIRLGIPGMYPGNATINHNLATLSIIGDAANQSQYVIGPVGVISSNVSITGVTATNVPGGNTVTAMGGAQVFLTNVTVQGNACKDSLILSIGTGSGIQINAGCILAPTGNNPCAFESSGGAINLMSDLTVTGNPTFTNAFCNVFGAGGSCGRSGDKMPVINGTAQGQRYYVQNLGFIQTIGGGPNYFPGTIAGTVVSSTYGVYG